MKWNKLLEKQLLKYLPQNAVTKEQLAPFLQAVNDSYNAYERDNELAERAFKLSEEDYIDVNGRLKEELDLKKLSIDQIKEAIAVIQEEEASPDTDRLPDMVAFLKNQITQRKEAENRLKASEELWQFALEGAGDGVWEYNFQTKEAYFSRQYKKMLGYEEAEFNNDPEEWRSRIHPDDLHLIDESDKDYFNLRQTSHHREYRIRHKDGHYIWILDRGMIVSYTPQGTPCRIVGTHADITERKLTEQAIQIKEEKYRNIIANMNLGLMEVDNDGIIQFANQSFCDMAGYSLEEIQDKSAASLFTSGENSELLHSKAQLRREGISDAYELAVKDKRGVLRWWLISGAPRYNDTGKLVGSIGIHLDITDQKRLQFELNEAREAAEQSARAKEAFLANMSHEIRTPMNAIIGMSRLLTKTPLNEQQQLFLDTINTATDHLMVVINDILDISKIEAGKLSLEEKGFHPEELLHHALRVMQPRAEEKELFLLLNIVPGIMPVLIGDAHRLNQVLLNLISNAIKFTEAGGITITCAALRSTHARQTITISIKDTGIGIEPEFITHLFDKFTQEDRSIARKYGGTGLGMAICKQLVELMGGTISVQSEKGKGTEVLLIIPFLAGSASDLPAPSKPSINTALLKGRKVLLAEDYEMNRLVVSTILQAYEVQLTEVTNGEEAVEALRTNSFDLVLMDIQMPVMSGLEATRIIRNELYLSIPILALTANAIKGESDRYIAAGMNCFIAKPFEENDLVEKMVCCIEGKKPVQPQEEDSQQHKANQPLFSIAKLKQVGAGNETFISKMLQLFLQQIPPAVAEIRAAHTRGDLKTMRALAHKMKPALQNMDIHSLREVVREIELLPDEEAGTERTNQMITTMETVITDIAKQLPLLIEQFTP